MDTCYRHPDRETNVACSRCGRPICPDCMTPTSVGMRCPECSGDRQDVRRPAFSRGSSRAQQAPATMVLIGLNAVVFLAQMATGGGAASFDTGSVFNEGALCANAVGSGGTCGFPPIVTEGSEWWRIVSAGFLHGGFLHLALNMFVLYILGRLVEPAVGTRRMLAIYAVSLIAGSFGALLLANPAQFTVGASGAIYGLFAATLLIARDRGMSQIVAQLGFWLLLNLVLTISVPGISIGGHLGGLVGGALAALVVLRAERGGARMRGPEIASLAALGVGFFAIAIAVAASATATTF
jgi:membrane associated rhomboid family serine protease